MNGMVTQTRHIAPDKTCQLLAPWSGLTTENLWTGYQCPSRPVQQTTSYRGSRAGRDMTEDHIVRKVDRFTQHDNGHVFNTVSQSCAIGMSGSWASANGWYRYTGPLVPRGNTHKIPLEYYPPVSSNSFDVSRLGALAINNVRPTNAAANLSQMLGEILRDGLPRLPGQASLKNPGQVAPNAGGEFLNLEFAWKPVVKDLAKLMHAVSESKRLMQQYERDSGRNVRRSFYFPAERTVDSEHVSTKGPAYCNPLNQSSDMQQIFGGSHRTTETVTTERTIWFKGCFTYHLENSPSIMGRMTRYEQMARRLLGPGLTPSTIYELTPWSWLVDWGLDLGTSIENAEAFSKDGLVMRYGYLMCTTVRTRQVTTTGITLKATGLPIGPVTATYVTTRKERVRASPFGFGINTEDFSPRQWSILAALRMTKSPRIAW